MWGVCSLVEMIFFLVAVILYISQMGVAADGLHGQRCVYNSAFAKLRHDSIVQLADTNLAAAARRPAQLAKEAAREKEQKYDSGDDGCHPPAIHRRDDGSAGGLSVGSGVHTCARELLDSAM